jgi:hypothetical protein
MIEAIMRASSNIKLHSKPHQFPSTNNVNNLEANAVYIREDMRHSKHFNTTWWSNICKNHMSGEDIRKRNMKRNRL